MTIELGHFALIRFRKKTTPDIGAMAGDVQHGAPVS